MLQYVAVCCSVLQCVAVHCSTLYHVAACVNCVMPIQKSHPCCSALQCIAVRCSTLHRVAVCVIQFDFNREGSLVLQCALQYVAVCCGVCELCDTGGLFYPYIGLFYPSIGLFNTFYRSISIIYRSLVHIPQVSFAHV